MKRIVREITPNGVPLILTAEYDEGGVIGSTIVINPINTETNTIMESCPLFNKKQTKWLTIRLNYHLNKAK